MRLEIPKRIAMHFFRGFVPEILISLYEPRTLALALERTGFRPRIPGFSAWALPISFDSRC
jgi:hypothetical protein